MPKMRRIVVVRKNWRRIVGRIYRDGRLSQREIGEAIGKTQAWVSSLMLGRYEDVRWHDGEAILALQDRVFSAAKAKRTGNRKAVPATQSKPAAERA